MSVLKDGKKWRVSLRLGGREGVRVRKTGFETKTHAQRYEREQIQRFEQSPDDFKRDSRRLSDLVESWYTLHGHTLKDPYRHDLLKNISSALGDPLARRFTSLHFANYRQELLTSGRKPSTANRHLRVYCAMFNELNRLGVWLHDNPLSKLRQIKVDEFELTYLSSHQIPLLLEACQQGRNTHTYVVAMICLATGARWSEAEGLRRNQVKDGRITYNRTKSSKSRSVPISPALTNLIEENGYKGLAHDRLFDGCKGAFRSAYARAGLNGSTPGQLTHILRHTFASHFMMNGGRLETLQKILGHGSITMTMRYAHFSPDYLDDAVKLNPVEFVSDKESRGKTEKGDKEKTGE